MLLLTIAPTLQSLLLEVGLAFSATELKILRRLRTFSRPAPVRIKVPAPANKPA